MQSRAGRLDRASCVGLAWVLCTAAAVSAAVAPPAGAARPAKGASYDWMRDRVELPTRILSFTVSRTGATLGAPHFLIGGVPCSNGRSRFAILPDLDRPWRLKIARDGSFGGTYAVSSQLLDPFVVSEEYWLSGTFIRRGNAARVLFRVRQVGEGGTVCDTGNRRVTARRERPING